jgi:hypothetical protein
MLAVVGVTVGLILFKHPSFTIHFKVAIPIDKNNEKLNVS